MSETQSDADKIRSKRLAKLQSQASVRSNGVANPNPEDASGSGPIGESSSGPQALSEASRPPEQAGNVSGAATAAPRLSTPPNPFAELHIKPADGALSKIRIRSSDAGLGASASDQNAPVKAARLQGVIGSSTSVRSASSASTDAWEDRVLRTIFRITLDPEQDQDGQGHPLRFVPGVRAELEEQGEPLRLSVAVLEQAILEAGSQEAGAPPLDYLLACWKRVSRQFRGMRNEGPEEPRYRIVREARRLCMSYAIFAVTMPEMFGAEASTVNPLAPHLLVDPDDDRGVCHEFLSEAVKRSDEDESIKEALVNAADELSRQLAEMTMNDNYKPFVLALRNLMLYPPLVDAITSLPSFLPANTPAQNIEKKTFLGPFFQISPLQGEVTVNYFSSPKARDRGYIINSQKALRMTVQAHQTDLLDIANHFIRASKKSRDAMLDWFALTVNANHKRRALQVDNAAVTSDGCMINVTVVLDQLCEPFMDATFSKIDRIDVDYLRRQPRVDIKEETKLNADQQASDHFYATTAAGQSNFISEIFFLTLAAHHYGTEATITKLDQLEKDLRHLEKQTSQFEAERSNWENARRDGPIAGEHC
ncbi:MAG: hypothetical protein M1826_003006 [Phylliscum demangeonii]|nr:MAG: hypothetical protein M1826_003006 [Phylliscum demangeonii]